MEKVQHVLVFGAGLGGGAPDDLAHFGGESAANAPKNVPRTRPHQSVHVDAVSHRNDLD